jgi:hypothetical protein
MTQVIELNCEALSSIPTTTHTHTHTHTQCQFKISEGEGQACAVDPYLEGKGEGSPQSRNLS